MERRSIAAPLPRRVDPALASWEPAAGSHSPSPNRRCASGAASRAAAASSFVVTDHTGETLPFGASRLAVGSPLDNVGSPASASTRKTTRRSGAPPSAITPPPPRPALGSSDPEDDAPRPVPSRSSPGRRGFSRASSPRASTASPSSRARPFHPRRLPPPRETAPKRLLVSRTGAASAESLIAGLIGSLENTAQAARGGNTRPLVRDLQSPRPRRASGVSIVLMNQEQVPGRILLSGPFVASNHPLVADLDWQGLIARSTPSIPMAEGDLVLLWLGERPLVFFAKAPGNASSSSISTSPPRTPRAFPPSSCSCTASPRSSARTRLPSNCATWNCANRSRSPSMPRTGPPTSRS